jgi:MHS family proline/betaine transporter-like MFS transporter
MMLLSMSLMTCTMLATALLPTRAEIGPAAGGLLVLLRCVVAFSVGGEYTGVVAYLLEGAPQGRRGLLASLAAAASEIGGLLAAGVCAVTAASMSSADLALWGWRAPFFFGAALAGVVWIMRLAMQESPEYERQQSAGVVPSSPLRLALSDYRAAIVRGFAISALGSITYYVGITYVPAFLVAVRTMQEGDAFWVSTIAACVVVLVTPAVGASSDILGRKPVLVLLCGGSVVLPISMFALMAGGSAAQALAGAAALAALGGGISAVGAVTSAELLPGEGRLSGLAFGSTLATAIFGGLTPFLSQYLIERIGWRLIPGVMIAAVAICILPVLLTAPETRPRLE